MKIKELYNKAVENWPVKAVCIVLSLICYCFYIVSNQESRSFVVPLTIRAENGIAAAENYPSNVKITLKGKVEDINSVRESDVGAFLDLNYLSKDGTYKLPVLVSLPKEAMLFDTLEVNVQPQTVELKVEEMISGFVPVSPLLKGTVADGFEIKSTSVSPDSVEITGPRSMVENCRRVQTGAVSVKNAHTSISTKTGVENPGRFLKIKDGDSVSVTVEIVPVIKTKKIENIPVVFDGVKDGFEITPSQRFVTVSLRGTSVEVGKLTAAQGSVKADCSALEAEGTYQLPLSVRFPAGIEVLEVSSKYVDVVLKKIAVSEENPEAEGGEQILEEKIIPDAVDGQGNPSENPAENE